MRYRKLGRSDISISEIGFGCWGIGGTKGGARAYGETNDVDSVGALERAIELGINFFDTSDLYGFGYSEGLLGRVLEKNRSDIVIATKAGLLNFVGGKDFSVQHLQSALESSLKRLRTDYVDIFQLHSPSLEEVTDEVVSGLSHLRKQGKIRAIGVSARSPEDALTIIERYSLDCIQVNFNFVDQRANEIGLFAACERKNVAIICRTPLCFGFLTGKYTGENLFAEGDHRAQWSEAQRSKWCEASKLFTEKLSRETGDSAATIALRFCLSYPAITSVIPGMLKIAEVEENAGAVGAFSEQVLADFEKLYRNNVFFSSK